MGALRQLGALFWKNFLIRKRHPTFLVLEVLWPVVLFVALALMRLGFQPDHRETCEYQERAVPSAGLVPFLQSSICTLNNNCSTRAWNQQRAEAQQRFQTMIRDIDPLLTKESTIQAFKALPTVNVVLNAVKDVADGTTVEEMDNKLVLRNMVRDPAAVVDILSDKYKILERRVAESLLDASINPLALVSSIGSVDFKGIVCDPDELEKYIILSDKSNRYVVNKYSVSNSLCRIEEDKISDITNDLIRQLDVANIIRLIQDLSNVTGSFDLAVLMEDMADLVDMFMDKSSLLSMMENLPDLSAISGAFTQLGKLVPMLNDLADMGWLESIEEAIRRASKGLADLDGELDLGLINSFGLGLPQTMSDVPLKEASDILNMFLNGVSWEDMSMNDTLEYIDNMMPEMFGNKTANMVMAMATNMMEMMDEIRVHTKKMEKDLKYTIQNTEAVTVSLNELEAAGPEMTYIFMAEMVTMENIYLLMSGESTSADICKDAVSVTYDGIPGYDTDVVVQTICSDGATAAIDQVFTDNSMSSLTVQLEKEMEDMDSIMKGTIPADQEIGNMKDMYYEMSDMLQELMGTVSEDDDEWNLVLANTNIDYMGSYNWVFGMIGSQYRVQTKTMLPVVIVAKSAENGPMWESTFKPWFEMLDAILHTALNRVQLFEEMNKDDKIITKVVKYLPYYPNILQSAAGTNLSELARMLTSTDTTELTKLLCEKTDWNSLNVADDISIYDMKMFVCQTNITKFVEDVWNIADPLSFLSDVELEVEHNLENGINWPRMVEDVQYLYQTLNGKNSVQDLLYTVFTSDLSMIYNYYTVGMELLTNMTMDTVTSDMENVSELETSLKSLDEALATWDLWKRVKHYIRTWNLLAKVLNHYAELTQDPNWDITEYVTTVSPTLGKYLQNSTDSMPEVIDALQKAAYNPQQMIERVMNIDYMGFCEDPESMSSLLGVKSTPSFTKFQNGLCELNWTQIMDELTTSASPWSDFASQWEMISTYDTESLPPISLNWTDVISTTRKFLDYINKGMFNNFVPDLSNAGLTGTNSSISNLTSALQNTWDYDADAIGKSVDQIWKLLFDMSAQNDTFIEMWQYNVAIQSYINYHLFKFVNIHLDIINRTKVFDLRAHLNSPRTDKLFQVMVDSPELNAVILHNLQTAGGVEKWLTLNFDTLCTNTSQLEDAIQMPENSNITKTEIVDAVCAAFGEEIIDEVRAGMEGLDDFLNAMDNIISMNMTASELLVDYSKIAVVVERYSELLVSLSTADVQVKGLPFIMDGEITRLLEQFMDMPTQLANIYDTTDPLKTLQDEQMLQGLMQLQDIPEVRDIMRISETYMRVLTAVLMKTEGMNLDPATGFQGYPEMYKMWQMLEWLPQLYVTFSYTSLVDNSKITTFTEAAIQGTDAICEADPYDLMTNPPILNIKFEDFFNLFCSVNFTLLEHEASDFIQAKEISEAYGNISSVSEKVDIDGWLAEYDRFMKQVEQFINKTGEFNIPGFDNMTVWEKIYDFLENTTNSLDTLTMASQNMDGLLEALVSMSPEFQNQLKSMEITNYVMGKMLDHLENMTGDSYKLEDFFHGFGQIQRLVMMLQEPGVMETLMASINTPKFTALLENTNATAVLIDICDSDITKYMTIPPSVTANMNDVKDRFCDTDFEILMTEFVDAFFIQDIIDMMETNTTLNWRLITEQNSQLTEKLGKWLESPPNLDVPTRWENSTYWFQLLDLLNGEQAVETSDPTLETLLKGMENFLGSQYTDIVKSISPLAIQLMQMIELDSDAKRTFATIDLFLDYMVDRLMDVSDNFTVGSLSKNSSEIVRFMEALANLRDISNTDYEALNKTVNQEKLYNLLLDPDMLMDMCENDNVAAYISANGTASKASIALEEVICIDTETWSEILQDQVNLEMFEEKLAEIWNDTNTNAHLNWTSLAGNVEKFVNMLSNWMERPPEESSPLSQWTDWEGILSFFDSLYKDPSVGSNILSNINPLFGSEMNNLTNAFNRLLMPFIKQLTSNDIEELYSNPEKLGSLIESILSVEDWLKVLSEFFNAYYSPDEDAPTRESILKSLVCGENEKVHEYMERYIYEMITGDPAYIWMLCNVDIAEWNNTLKSNSYTEWDLYQVQMMLNQAVEDKMSEHDDKVASKTVLEMLEKLNLDGLLNSSSTTEDWLRNSQDTGLEGLMYVLEMIAEEDILKDFKAMLLIIIEVQEYINTMLEKFTARL